MTFDLCHMMAKCFDPILVPVYQKVGPLALLVSLELDMCIINEVNDKSTIEPPNMNHLALYGTSY